jgi:3-(3-hydroxy-phenyl)propionate hydroxylase
MEIAYDVAVVGYGPTGLVAASRLGQLGHRVAVIERWPSLYGLPRITHIDDETARIVQACGDVDEALRDITPTVFAWFNGKGDNLLTIPNVVDGPMGYPAHMSVHQPDIEDAIDERVRSLPNVDILTGWCVTGLHQDREHAMLELARWLPDSKSADHDDRAELVARYVIAADGSRSAVREALGVEREDLGFNVRWLNVDTERRRDLGPHFAQAKQFCDPARGYMFMPIGRFRQRFEFAVLDDEPRELVESEPFAWELLERHHGLGPDDVTIARQIEYQFESRIAQTWQRGRVFLAGDAAHTMPPYIGQGACSGMRDAFNLAWRLDLVLSGRAAPELLKTYEPERRPQVTAMTQISIALGGIANLRDPAAAAQRDAAFLSGNAPPPPGFPGVVAGVIRRSDDGAPTAGAGVLTPQGRIALDGRSGRFDDVVGSGFWLLTRTDVREVLGSERRLFLEQIGCRLVALENFDDLEGRYGTYLDDLGVDAVLARPDTYVFGIAEHEADVAALVDDLRASAPWLEAPSPAAA